MAGSERKDSQHRVAVATWMPRELAKATPATPPAITLRVPPTVAGVLGTIALHVLLWQSFVVLGFSTHKARLPEAPGPGSIAMGDGAAADRTLVLLQPIASQSAQSDPFEELASRGAAALNQSINIISPDPSPPAPDLRLDTVDDSTAEAAVASGDPPGHARLFGIYTAQMHARIERLWRRPRTPVSGLADRLGTAADRNKTFRCRVQIVQNHNGEVQEVLLPHCNGSTAWRQSLVRAINEASPLPAPPEPAVFTQTITLEFIGLPFSDGSLADEYELAPAIARAERE